MDEDEEVFEIQRPKWTASQSSSTGSWIFSVCTKWDGWFCGVSARVYWHWRQCTAGGPVPNVPVPNASVAGQADEDEDEDDAADDSSFSCVSRVKVNEIYKAGMEIR